MLQRTAKTTTHASSHATTGCCSAQRKRQPMHPAMRPQDAAAHSENDNPCIQPCDHRMLQRTAKTTTHAPSHATTGCCSAQRKRPPMHPAMRPQDAAAHSENDHPCTQPCDHRMLQRTAKTTT